MRTACGARDLFPEPDRHTDCAIVDPLRVANIGCRNGIEIDALQRGAPVGDPRIGLAGMLHGFHDPGFLGPRLCAAGWHHRFLIPGEQPGDAP